MLARIITAALLIPLALLIVYVGGWLATVSVLGIGHLLLKEYYEMVDQKFGKQTTHWLGHGLFAASVGLLYATGSSLAYTIHATALVSVLVLALVELRLGRFIAAHHYCAYQIRIPVSIALLLSSLIALRGLPNGILWVCLGLALTWITDSLGLLIGKTIGKRKLAPRISPGKTIAGSVGPLIILTGLVFGLHYYTLLPPAMLWITPLVIVFAQLGDLHESLLKRYCNIKDSSAIIPGHGGVYDRMDSLLFSVSILYLCVYSSGL